MAVLCLALPYKNSTLGFINDLPFESVVELAIAANKYDCLQSIRLPILRDCLEKHRNLEGVEENLLLAYVARAFDNHTIFNEACCRVVMEWSPKDSQNLHKLLDTSLLPEKMIGEKFP